MLLAHFTLTEVPGILAILLLGFLIGTRANKPLIALAFLAAIAITAAT